MALRRGRRSRQGTGHAGLHEVRRCRILGVQAMPRRAALQAGLPRAPHRDGARVAQAVLALWRGGRIPRGALRGDRADRLPPLPGLPDALRAADVRGDDRQRRLVGLRRRARHPPRRRPAARPSPTPCARSCCDWAPATTCGSAARRSCARTGSRRAPTPACSTPASSRACPTTTSSPARRSAGRCANTPRPNPAEVVRYVDHMGITGLSRREALRNIPASEARPTRQGELN